MVGIDAKKRTGSHDILPKKQWPILTKYFLLEPNDWSPFRVFQNPFLLGDCQLADGRHLCRRTVSLAWLCPKPQKNVESLRASLAKKFEATTD